jgi:hypothetical protein
MIPQWRSPPIDPGAKRQTIGAILTANPCKAVGAALSS